MDIVNHHITKQEKELINEKLKSELLAFDLPDSEESLSELNPESAKFPESLKSKTSLRMHYEAQAQVIQNQIGDLEQVRAKLGLSARKICQLLLVDPSAWTRWKKGETPPPHVWRALQWYMTIQEKIPGLTPQYFIGKDPQIVQQNWINQFREAQEFSQNIHQKNQELEAKVKTLEGAVRANRITAVTLGLATLILAFAFFKALKG